MDDLPKTPRRQQTPLSAVPTTNVIASSSKLDLTLYQVNSLTRRKRSLERWLMALLMLVPVTLQGSFDDVKATYLAHLLDPLFLIAVQTSVSMFIILCIWYIAHELAPVNEILDSSRLVEQQLGLISQAHHNMHAELFDQRSILHRIRDALPDGGTYAAFMDAHT